jgi:hypothetical protein
MSNRIFWAFAFVLLLLIGTQVALVIGLRRSANTGTVVCRALNAGLPLDAGDGSVLVYRAGSRNEPVGRGALGAPIQLGPGTYDLHVLFTRSRDHQETWLEQVHVVAGSRVDRQVEFSAGQLAVTVTVGRKQALATDAVIQVLDVEHGDRAVTSFHPGEIAVLRAGRYNIRVALVAEGRENATRWLRDVTLRPGVLTTETTTFQQGTVLVSATNAGQALPVGSVTLNVYQAGDVQEELVETGSAGVPLALAAGRYDVKAALTERGETADAWLRNIEVRENDAIERKVELSFGTAVVQAFVKNGAELTDYQVYTYFYRPDDHEQPVTYAPAGQPVRLMAGRYDMRASFFRSGDKPDIWKRGLVVRTGQTLAENVSFPSGRLLVRAYDASGAELLGDNVFLFFYVEGARTTPVARARAGEEVVLSEGVYDVRASDTRASREDQWLQSVRVQAGRAAEASIRFARSASGSSWP